jgi:hypothetical protein
MKTLTLAALTVLSAFGQIVLVPDTAEILEAPPGVTVRPSSDGKVAITANLTGVAPVTVTGTIELVAPDPPAGTSILGDRLTFPGTAVQFTRRQTWNAGVTGRFSVADTGDSSGFTSCVESASRESVCNVQRMKLDNADPRRAYLDATITFGTSTNFGPGNVVIRFRWLTNATLQDSVFFATRPTGAVDAGKLAVDPLPETTIAGEKVPILAVVGFRLLSRTSAMLRLELSVDPNGKDLIATSRQIPISAGQDLSAVQFVKAVLEPEDYLRPVPYLDFGYLSAVLTDASGARLKESAYVRYLFTPGPELRFTVEGPSDHPVGLCGQKLGAASNAHSPQSSQAPVIFKMSFTSIGNDLESANFYLNVILHNLDGTISQSSRKLIRRAVLPEVEIQEDMYRLGDVLTNVKEVHIVAEAEMVSNGRRLLSNPYVVPVECIGFTTRPPRRGKIGESVNASVGWSIRRGPAIVSRDLAPTFHARAELGSKDSEILQDKIPLVLAAFDARPNKFTIQYQIERPGQGPDPAAVANHTIDLEYPSILNNGTADLPKAKLENIQTKSPVQITARTSGDLLLPLVVIAPVPGILDLFQNAKVRAATATGPLLGINQTWEMTPGTPRDGSFSADLTLFYDPEALPADPNFDESKLEIIAHDPATGELERIPSIVDRTQRAVRGRIDRLAPVYTLAVPGPFATSLLGAPALSAGGGFDAGLAVVNPGDSAVPIEVRAFNPGPIDLPVTLAPGQQLAGVLNQLVPQAASSPIAWLTARGAANTVAAQLLYAGSAFDVLPVQASAERLVLFPNVQRSAKLNTEFHIANPEPADVELTLSLFALDGTSAGKLTRTLPATAKMQVHADDAFPALPSNFAGYAVLRASRGLFAAAVQIGRGVMAATNAQPLAAASGPVRLRAPYLGSDSATIALVNTGSTEARVTIRGWRNDGTQLPGAPADMFLAPGQGYQSTLAAAFNTSSLPEGSITVEASTGYVFGELTIGDVALGQLTAMPLAFDGLATQLVPYMANDQVFQTSLVVASTGQPATATVTAHRPTGAVLGTARVTLAANGRSVQALPALIPATAGLRGGYLRISADQPILAYASVNSAVTETATIPGQSAGPATAGPGAAAENLSRITPLIARGWPNERTFDNPPRNAVDGNTSSFTWTTNPNNTAAPSYFGVDFGATKPVSRIRLYKDNDGGGGTQSDPVKNLIIEYTTSSPAVPLEGRTWVRVSGLTNGYLGAELLTAAAVNADGTVTRDSHNSTTNGWASLSFAPVEATAVRIGFSNVTSNTFFNHYKVHEFEAYGAPSSGGGPGTVSPLTVVPALLTWETAESGQTKTAQVTNPNSSAVTITRITSSNPSFVPVTQAPVTLPARATNNISIRYSPAGAGEQTGTIALETDPPAAGTEFRVSGAAQPAPPAITLSPAPPYNFGSGNVGATGSIAVTLTNTGGTAVTINSISGSNPAFRVAESLPITIPAGGSARLTLRFTPAAAGAQSDTWTLVTSPPSVIPPFGLSGNGVAVPPAQVLEITAGTPLAPVTTWDFGTTDSVLFRVNNKSAATVSVSVTFSNARFSLARPTSQPFPIGGGSFENAQIAFRPLANDTAVQTGTVTFTAGGQSVAVSLRATPAPVGSGGGGGTQPALLSIDKGSFESVAGFPGGGLTGFFVNRLTPPSYPATLRSVLVYFPEGELPIGAAVTILSAQHPSGTGGPTLTGLSFQRTPATIRAHEVYSEIPVAPITITAGDFVVGFSAMNPAGIYPVVVDTGSGSRQRSYLGSDDTVLRLADASNVGAGNFGIRARVDLGSGTTTTNPLLRASVSSLALETSAARTLTVTNAGTGSANATFSVSGPFTVSPASATLAPGASATLTVNFRPTASTPATQTGTLTLAASGAASVTVSLTGTVAATGGGTGDCAAAPANLISWYGGDGNASDQTGANPGTAQGGAGYAAGQVGQAFNLNGTGSYIQLGNPANLRLTTGVTIEAWIHPRSVRTQTAGPPMGAIVTKWAQIFTDVPDSDSYGLWIINNNGTINLFGAIHQPGPREPTIQGGVIPLNAWSHVAMTFDGASGAYRLYVNGAQVASQTSVGNLFATGRNVNIGREDSYIQRLFDGLIDEASIYGRALSAAEIQATYAAGAAGKCKGGATATTPPLTNGPYAVRVSPTTVRAGQAVTVTWTAPNPTSVRNWVGLFRQSDATSSANLFRPAWQYVETAPGSTVLQIPPGTPPGSYVFHYFTDDGYTNVAATSNVITVTP